MVLSFLVDTCFGTPEDPLEQFIEMNVNLAISILNCVKENFLLGE